VAGCGVGKVCFGFFCDEGCGAGTGDPGKAATLRTPTCCEPRRRARSDEADPARSAPYFDFQK